MLFLINSPPQAEPKAALAVVTCSASCENVLVTRGGKRVNRQSGQHAIARRTNRAVFRARSADRGEAGFALLFLAFWVVCLSFLPRPAQALEELRISIPGASSTLTRTIESSSFLVEARDQGDAPPLEVMSAARAEYGRLLGLLYEEGYFAPVISIRIDGREAADMPLGGPPQRIGLVELDIALGPQFTFGTVEIAPLAPGTELPDGFEPGQPARSTQVRDAMLAALEGWRAQGHALAAPAGQQITAVHGTEQLNVVLRLAPGPALNFGALVPRGVDRTRPERVVAIAGLRPGERYDPDQVARAETRLRRTGAFTSVALRTAEEPNDDGSINVDALIEEAPRRRIGLGAEIDSEAGGRLTGFWLHRNLMGGAERLRLEAAVEGIAARVGGIGFSAEARYTRPATFGRDTDLELGLNLSRTDERDFEADAITADARLLHRFSDELTGSLGLALRYERARFGIGRASRGNFGTLGLPVALTWDRRDSLVDPRRGYYLFGQVMPYAGFGDASAGARLRMDARGYLGLGQDDRLVLAGRAQGGAILASGLGSTPRDFLFYSGGGGTVRGLPFQSLGVSEGGVESGGRAFAALSAEARARVTDTASVVAFADAGYVSAGVLSGSSDWHAGAGLGVRFATPVGPLRLDIATPVRRNASATGARRFQIYVGLGQAF